VCFSLLVLCYLEVVLWTSCLFASAAAVSVGVSDSHSYLIRETGNLKYAGVEGFELAPLLAQLQTLQQASLTLVLACSLEQQRLERRHDADVLDSLDVQAPALNELRIVQSDLTGLPAPFSGISAID